MGRAKGGQSKVSVATRFSGAMAPGGVQTQEETPLPQTQQASTIQQGFAGLFQTGAGRTVSSNKTVRSLAGRSFVNDREAWKEQENEFIEGARAELDAGMREFAKNGQWGTFIKMYSQSPDYSLSNNLWARGQLRYRWRQLVEAGEDPAILEDPTQGRFFSASAAKALGARVRAEYFYKPSDPNFDDRYLVEMAKPLGFDGFWKEIPQVDAAGNPIMDASGEQKVKREFVKLRAKGYGTFHAYHEKALVDAEGNPFKMPEMPWQNASGSEEDAEKLFTDLTRICAEEGLSVDYAHLTPNPSREISASLPEHSSYDKEKATVSLDPDQEKPEQAVALLRAICEHFAYDSAPRDDRERKVRRAAAESAKYAIASLYGLESQEQTFPYLIELADDDKSISQVASDTHQRVQRVLAHLDPIMRAKARSEGERRKRTPRRTSAKSKAA